MKTTLAVLRYAQQPEAFRETQVLPGEWSWRDQVAGSMWAQRDYDTRRLESITTGAAMRPCGGWSFVDRLLARGELDAAIQQLKKLGWREPEQEGDTP